MDSLGRVGCSVTVWGSFAFLEVCYWSNGGSYWVAFGLMLKKVLAYSPECLIVPLLYKSKFSLETCLTGADVWSCYYRIYEMDTFLVSYGYSGYLVSISGSSFKGFNFWFDRATVRLRVTFLTSLFGEMVEFSCFLMGYLAKMMDYDVYKLTCLLRDYLIFSILEWLVSLFENGRVYWVSGDTKGSDSI